MAGIRALHLAHFATTVTGSYMLLGRITVLEDNSNRYTQGMRVERHAEVGITSGCVQYGTQGAY